MTGPRSQPGGQGELPPLFRVTAISFDFREEVEAVTALAGGPCLSFIRAEAPGIQLPDGPAVLVTLPIDVAMRVFHAAGQVTGLDPRYDGSHPVWTSLNWVYNSLLAEELGETPAMTVTSVVLIKDPHFPHDVFAAACLAAGSSPEASDFYDFDDACMLMAREQGAEARVSVHYADTDLGGRTTTLYPQDPDGEPTPDCYSAVHLTTGAFAGNDEVWQHHAGLVRKMGPLLYALGLRWCWRVEDDDGPWLSHVPATRQDALAPLPLGRRTARTAAAPGPADVWQPLITATREFEPENDAALLAWMAGEAGGMAGYAEGLAAAYDTAVLTVGLDPVAVQALHECTEAAAFAAEQMAAARQRFTSHYAEVRQFTAGGGVLPFNGRWMTGEGN